MRMSEPADAPLCKPETIHLEETTTVLRQCSHPAGFWVSGQVASQKPAGRLPVSSSLMLHFFRESKKTNRSDRLTVLGGYMKRELLTLVESSPLERKCLPSLSSETHHRQERRWIAMVALMAFEISWD
jgi:hypothetical protein